jgi:ankyrin repeat protein
MMNKKTSWAKVAALFCVPLIPLVALPVIKYMKARAATQALQEEIGRSEPPATQWNLVEEFLSEGASANAPNEAGRKPLHVSVLGYAPSRAIQALLDNGADVNAVDDSEGTALLIAAKTTQVNTVRLLLSRGADPNIQVTINGKRWTALSRSQAMMADPIMKTNPHLKLKGEIIQMLKAAGAKEQP